MTMNPAGTYPEILTNTGLDTMMETEMDQLKQESLFMKPQELSP